MSREGMPNVRPHSHIEFVMLRELGIPVDSWEFSEAQIKYKVSVLHLRLSKWEC